MIWWIILWGVVVLICKTLRDASLYCWSHTWLSKTFLDRWNNARVPFDLRHVADGIIITGSFALIIKLYADPNFLLLVLYTLAFWIVFYQLFRLAYHKWIRK